MQLTAPKCVLAHVCVLTAVMGEWIAQACVKRSVWPPSLSHTLCGSTNCAAIQTHTYTRARSRAARHVPPPELAPLSVPGEHISRRAEPEEARSVNILREINLNMSWHEKSTAAVSSLTHTDTHTLNLSLSSQAETRFKTILDFRSNFF